MVNQIVTTLQRIVSEDIHSAFRMEVVNTVQLCYTFLLYFLFTYNSWYFIYTATIGLAFLITYRIYSYQNTEMVYFLFDMCYYKALLMTINVLYPHNQLLLRLGIFFTTNTFFISWYFKDSLQFNSVFAYTSSYMHLAPQIIYLALYREGMINLEDIDYFDFLPKAFLCMIAYFTYYYIVIFIIRYNHWKNKNRRTLYSTLIMRSPLKEMIVDRNLSDQIGGILYLLFFFVCESGLLAVSTIILRHIAIYYVIAVLLLINNIWRGSKSFVNTQMKAKQSK